MDLLSIDRGLVIAPAGCGKTQLIADALKRHDGGKPVLILTHTNAGVVALRSRLDKANVKPSAYRLLTIDGWSIRLVSTFPERAALDQGMVNGIRPNYPAIRTAAAKLLKNGHINDVIAASYARLLVDEYQDCSIRQHVIVYYASFILPVCVMGDDMQAIFGFGDDPLAEWEKHVCSHFPLIGTLDRPWRWINAGTEALGGWLLDARAKLIAGKTLDLRTLPAHVTWVPLNGTPTDHPKLLEACKTIPPENKGSVLIIGESTNPRSQRLFASQTPGAVTVEAVDLRDLVSFASGLDLASSDALSKIASFAEQLMTNVGAADLMRRVDIIMRGTERREASATERAAIAFLSGNRTYKCVAELLAEMNQESGVRVFRPAVLQACLRALNMCNGAETKSFHEAAVQMREQNRLLGRPLPRRAVGSTLLLKGLEAEVAVILNAEEMNARNLYVAMTRGSKRIVVCSRTPILNPVL